MSAATSDGDSGDSSDKQYYFECIGGGGHNSGWQDNNSYQDTGLSGSTLYTYRVKARDKNAIQNETEWSSEKSSTTTGT
jgi:hypothetical protein